MDEAGQLEVSNCTFEKNVGLRTGVIDVKTMPSVAISDSRFYGLLFF